jgi:hypothetical protein
MLVLRVELTNNLKLIEPDEEKWRNNYIKIKENQILYSRN